MHGVLNVCKSHKNNSLHRSGLAVHKHCTISILIINNRRRTTTTTTTTTLSQSSRLKFSPCHRH